jgi:hypothetical protein
MNIDPVLAKFIMWIIGFLFTALIGILVWLSKSVMTKIDVIVKNQENDAIDRTGIKKDIDVIKTDMSLVKLEMKDISDIKQKLVRIETNEVFLLDDVSTVKDNISTAQKKLNELSEKVLVQEQIISMLKPK